MSFPCTSLRQHRRCEAACDSLRLLGVAGIGHAQSLSNLFFMVPCLPVCQPLAQPLTLDGFVRRHVPPVLQIAAEVERQAAAEAARLEEAAKAAEAEAARYESKQKQLQQKLVQAAEEQEQMQQQKQELAVSSVLKAQQCPQWHHTQSIG